MKGLKPCGHRLADIHFIKIRRKAREWKMLEAEALRKIIETYESNSSR